MNNDFYFDTILGQIGLQRQMQQAGDKKELPPEEKLAVLKKQYDVAESQWLADPNNQGKHKKVLGIQSEKKVVQSVINKKQEEGFKEKDEIDKLASKVGSNLRTGSFEGDEKGVKDYIDNKLDEIGGPEGLDKETLVKLAKITGILAKPGNYLNDAHDAGYNKLMEELEAKAIKAQEQKQSGKKPEGQTP